jgi:opacity protein-like surface antigen
MKRRSLCLSTGLLLLAAVLLALPGPAPAEMYVEAYLGGVQGANTPLRPGISDSVSINFGEFQVDANFRAGRIPGKLDPAVMGGLKIGTWFVKEGFLGMNYPSWMRYFGFYLDFMMHRLNFRRQAGTAALALGGVTIPGSFEFSSEGIAPTLAFMFAARYGFFPDSEVPFGRLQPYVAVGPAIMFASQQPTFNFTSLGVGRDLESQSTAVICLAVEAGLRWMALKNVSIDVSFKYRYAEPSFSYTFLTPITQQPATLTLDPTFHLFSGQIGAAYHF